MHPCIVMASVWKHGKCCLRQCPQSNAVSTVSMSAAVSHSVPKFSFRNRDRGHCIEAAELSGDQLRGAGGCSRRAHRGEHQCPCRQLVHASACETCPLSIMAWHLCCVSAITLPCSSEAAPQNTCGMVDSCWDPSRGAGATPIHMQVHQMVSQWQCHTSSLKARSLRSGFGTTVRTSLCCCTGRRHPAQCSS